MNESVNSRELVEKLAEEFAERYRHGERPAVEEYVAAHPECAAEIRELFPALMVLEELAPSDDGSAGGAGAPAAAPPPERIGDYRILRQIGRGGMGVVYEAEQQSLGRRVALKVLPTQTAGDARVLERFRRESRAAAGLHHTNIVPVFEVGQDGGVFYYAMQFIQGQALDEVVKELQRLRSGGAGTAAPLPSTVAGPVTHSLWSGQFALPGDAADGTPVSGPAPAPTAGSAASLRGCSDLSAVESNYGLYCRNMARIGLQVADALAYAHARGIIHRDVKPSNLLLDTAGVVWVTDFGLAKTDDRGLTQTGDLVGTLRYMAPERFRGECNAGADVYALGLTLYELLVLRPAFTAADRLRLMEHIARQEPARPRVLDPRIPRDLETVVLKAMDKEPARRYGSADELAADLRRFLADEPIQARPVRAWERMLKWARRRPAVAVLAALVLLATALGFAGVTWQWREAAARATAESQAKDRAERAQQDTAAALAEADTNLYCYRINLTDRCWSDNEVLRAEELLDACPPNLRGWEWHYLKRRCHSELLALRVCPGKITAVAFSPDNQRLASASWNTAADGERVGEVQFWEATTGQRLLTMPGPRYVWGMAFSPDSQRLALASIAGTVNILDAATGREVQTLRGHTGEVYSVAFSPDGRCLASGGHDRTVRIWDVLAGQEIRTLRQHTGFVYSVAFSPDGQRLASGSADKTVTLWDTATGQVVRTFGGHVGLVSKVAFGRDGRTLASVSWDGTMKVWNVSAGREIRTIPLDSIALGSVALSPDGDRAASACADKSIKVWDTATGRELHTLHGSTTFIGRLAFSPDGQRLVSAGTSGDDTGRVLSELKVWDVLTSQGTRTWTGHGGQVLSVAYSPDGRRLASAGEDRRVKVWEAALGRDILTLDVRTGPVFSVAFSPDGKHLACGSAVLDPAGSVRVLGKRVWDNTVGATGEVKVWDTTTGAVPRTLGGHRGEVSSVAFSPDGRRLASASADQTVKVWDVPTGRDCLTFRGHTGRVTGVAFSPDGRCVASASEDATVRLWDAVTGDEVLTLRPATGGVFCVAFSPDGRRIVSGGPLDHVRMWDAVTGQEAFMVRGPFGVDSVAFSRDGRRLAAAGAAAVKVWDATSGQELLTLSGHGRAVLDVTFSPDGHGLASANDDGTVRVWDAMPME